MKLQKFQLKKHWEKKTQFIKISITGASVISEASPASYHLASGCASLAVLLLQNYTVTEKPKCGDIKAKS